MSTLAKNVSQVVLYENQVSDFVALLWMQTPLGPRTNIVFAYIAHAKFQKASFNSNRDIRQNIRGDGGDGGDSEDGDRTQNNTSRRFQKRAGGKKCLLERVSFKKKEKKRKQLYN